jgi:hypothetical protein
MKMGLCVEGLSDCQELDLGRAHGSKGIETFKDRHVGDGTMRSTDGDGQFACRTTFESLVWKPVLGSDVSRVPPQSLHKWRVCKVKNAKDLPTQHGIVSTLSVQAWGLKQVQGDDVYHGRTRMAPPGVQIFLRR